MKKFFGIWSVALLILGCGGHQSTGNENAGREQARVPAATTYTNAGEAVTVAGEAANGGDIDGAIEVLENLHNNKAGDTESYLLLGRLLDYDGRPDEAVMAWKSGREGTNDDVPLLYSIAQLRREQADKGPQYSHKRGTFSYRPAKPDDPSDEDYKAERLRMSAEALEAVLLLQPEDLNANGQLAEVYLASKRHEEALSLWKKMLEMNPDHPLVMTMMATTLFALDRKQEAQTAADRAVQIDDSQVMAHQLLQKIHTDENRLEEAAQHERKVTYYKWMPPFVDLNFSEERYAFIGRFSGGEQHEDGTEVDQKAEITKLLAAGTAESQSLLAAICWHHGFHGELEDRAFEALETQGARALLLGLLINAESTCTMRSAAHALARLKETKALGPLVERLPGDVRFVFDSDIAGALATLGDSRAIEPLIEVLAPSFRAPSNKGNDPMMTDTGRKMARERAALALGAFDMERSRRALEKCLQNVQVAGACQVALFRLDQDQSRLKIIEKHLKEEAFSSPTYILNYLKRLKNPTAKQLAERYKDDPA